MDGHNCTPRPRNKSASGELIAAQITPSPASHAARRDGSAWSILCSDLPLSLPSTASTRTICWATSKTGDTRPLCTGIAIRFCIHFTLYGNYLAQGVPRDGLILWQAVIRESEI